MAQNRYSTDLIRRRALHDEVAERIRDMILEGELPQGERVPERVLCERFGISRTPLREALKVLATEGLVDLMPNRGAKISQISALGLQEAFEVMGALEAMAGELACSKATEADVARIRELHREMLRHYEAGRLKDYFELNQAIHEALVATAGNRVLKLHYWRLRDQVARARFAANFSPSRWREAVGEHEEMLVALELRDGPRLAEIMKRHLDNKMKCILKVVKESTP